MWEQEGTVVPRGMECTSTLFLAFLLSNAETFLLSTSHPLNSILSWQPKWMKTEGTPESRLTEEGLGQHRGLWEQLE